jgi:hypothetical protein
MAGYARDDSEHSHGGMKAPGLAYLAAVLVAFGVLLTLSVVMTFSAHGKPPGPSASASTRYIYYFMMRKWHATQKRQNHAPAIVVLGGSGSLYSVRAAQVERALGVPVLNWGIHAGLGLDYLLFNARRVLRPGDIALLELEYEHYSLTQPDWTLADYVVPNDPAYLQSLGFRGALPVIQKLTLTEYLQRIRDRAQPADPYAAAAIIESINDSGDLIANHVSDQKDFHRKSLDGHGPLILSVERVQQQQLDKISAFIQWCGERNIQVVAGFPALLDDPTYHREPSTGFFAAIENFYHDAGVRMLGVPSDYFFPKQMFFDSRYHLNSDGAKAMSRKITSHLARVPWNVDGAAVAMRTSPSTPAELAVDFSAVGYPGFLEKVEGLSGREAWGRWTDGPHAVFHLAEELPRRFTLEIVVTSAFAQNADRPIAVRVGDVQREFVVSRQGNVVQIPFELPSDGHTIELVLPSPVSPKDLGLGQETRRLGIGLKSMRIVSQ